MPVSPPPADTHVSQRIRAQWLAPDQHDKQTDAKRRTIHYFTLSNINGFKNCLRTLYVRQCDFSSRAHI